MRGIECGVCVCAMVLLHSFGPAWAGGPHVSGNQWGEVMGSVEGCIPYDASPDNVGMDV